MRIDVTYAPATEAHAIELARVLRPKDRAELEALGKPDAGAAVLEALRVSTLAISAFYGAELGAIFGVAPIRTGMLHEASDVEQLWFLTGEVFGRAPLAFFRAGRELVRLLGVEHPVLVNFIDERYTEALSFARALGAQLGEPVPYGPFGLPFRPYRLEAH